MAPLPLEPGGRVAQTVSSPAEGSRVTLFSRDAAGHWTTHATWEQVEQGFSPAGQVEQGFSPAETAPGRPEGLRYTCRLP